MHVSFVRCILTWLTINVTSRRQIGVNGQVQTQQHHVHIRSNDYDFRLSTNFRNVIPNDLKR